MQYLVDTHEDGGIVQLWEYVDDEDTGRRVLAERLHVDGDTDIIEVERDEIADRTRQLYRAMAGMR